MVLVSLLVAPSFGKMNLAPKIFDTFLPGFTAGNFGKPLLIGCFCGHGHKPISGQKCNSIQFNSIQFKFKSNLFTTNIT